MTVESRTPAEGLRCRTQFSTTSTTDRLNPTAMTYRVRQNSDTLLVFAFRPLLDAVHLQFLVYSRIFIRIAFVFLRIN